MSAHTPGRWTVAKNRGTFVFSEDGVICQMHLGVATEANARLIAAAPEMYAALKAMLDPPAGKQVCDCVICQLDAKRAIAKAEGRA